MGAPDVAKSLADDAAAAGDGKPGSEEARTVEEALGQATAELEQARATAGRLGVESPGAPRARQRARPPARDRLCIEELARDPGSPPPARPAVAPGTGRWGFPDELEAPTADRDGARGR